MQEQQIDHVELRLRLGIKNLKVNLHIGTMFQYTGKIQNYKGKQEPEKQFRSMQTELYTLEQCIPYFTEHNKSFAIIMQFSKSLHPNKMRKEVQLVFDAMKKNSTRFYSIVAALDIVGDESHGYALQEYASIIQECNKVLKLPWLFHAGEQCSNLLKSVNNMQLALQYKAPRIGHGLYCFKDANLVQALKVSKSESHHNH